MKKKFKKTFTGYCQRKDLKEIKWSSDGKLTDCGSYIGANEEYDDDVELRIIVEEI